VFPTSGQSHGEHDPIDVSINTIGLESGPHTCNVTIESNGGNKTFAVAVNIIGDPSLSYAPESYDFGDVAEGETDSTVFEIWNKGGDVLTYTLTPECAWVSVSPTSGQSHGEHDPIIVKVDTTGLDTGPHTCGVYIESNGGNGTFTVTVTVVSAFEIEIEISGGFGVTVTIKNVGDVDVAMVDWNITLDGGLILLGGETSGKIVSIPAGDEATISSNLIFGFGNTVITVSAKSGESSDTEERDAFVLLFFILLVI
jgi:hypothetical protein